MLSEQEKKAMARHGSTHPEYEYTLTAFHEAIGIFAKAIGHYYFQIRTEHDQIWVGPDDLDLGKIDSTRLEDLGWEFDEGCGWSRPL